MKLAWDDSEKAFKYAFGRDPKPLAPLIVILHKDRLNELRKIFKKGQWFGNRWRGLLTENQRIGFIACPGGTSDVCDCLLHLIAFPPEKILYTGTCGSISDEISIGDICLINDAWMGGNLRDWLEDESQIVLNSLKVSSGNVLNLIKLQKLLKLKFGKNVIETKLFSIPFQAIESKLVLKKIKKLGANVIDMETAFVITLGNKLGIDTEALLWCTDLPESVSYYEEDENLKRIKHNTWKIWPEIIVEAIQDYL